MKLKPGDKVYRVCEYDHPDDRPHTWQLCAVTVKSATDRRIVLDRNFRDTFRTRYEPGALGRVFHATPEGALSAFEAQLRDEIANANKHIVDAARGLAWIRETGKEESRG